MGMARIGLVLCDLYRCKVKGFFLKGESSKKHLQEL